MRLWHGLYGADLATEAAFDAKVAGVVRAIELTVSRTITPASRTTAATTVRGSTAETITTPSLTTAVAVDAGRTASSGPPEQHLQTTMVTLAEATLRRLKQLHAAGDLEPDAYVTASKVATVRWLVASGVVEQPRNHSNAAPYGATLELFGLHPESSRAMLTQETSAGVVTGALAAMLTVVGISVVLRLAGVSAR